MTRFFHVLVIFICFIPQLSQAYTLNLDEPAIDESLPAILKEILLLRSDKMVKIVDGNAATVRLKALREQAFILGSQAGLHIKGNQIQDKIEKQANSLDKTWRFDSLMLYQNHVLPPVISDIRGSQDIERNTRVSIGRNLMIVKPAMFVQYPSTWREYLLMSPFDKPDLDAVNTFFLPTSSEVKVWRSSVMRGYRAGVKQAMLVMSDGIHRLSRDFNGMIQYHILLAMHMITPPFVSERRANVTLNADGEMDIDKRVQTMTVKPMFNSHDASWVAVPGVKSAF